MDKINGLEVKREIIAKKDRERILPSTVKSISCAII